MNFSGKMGQDILVIGPTIQSTGKVIISGPMVGHMLVIGSMATCMAKGYSRGEMVVDTKVAMKMIK